MTEPIQEPATEPEPLTEQPAQEPESPAEPDVEEQEAEEAAEQEQAETPAEEQPEAPEARWPTPEQIEKRNATAERRFATYTRAVSDLWEEEATYLVPVSVSPSAPPGFLDVRDAGRVPDEIKQPILEFLGFAREQDYEPDPQTRECRTCKGKGKTNTGSHVPGRETRACPACNGSGAEGLELAAIPHQGNGTTSETFTLAPTGGEVAVEADNWGQPRILPDGRENPNWGRQPQFWQQVEPWGDTRNLTAMDTVG